MSSLHRKLKRNISSYYEAASSFNALNSQATLTDINRTNSTRTTANDNASHSSSETLQEREQTTAENTAENANSSSTETPLPFRPSLWRVPTSINVRSVHNTPDLERGPSMKSSYFLDDSTTNNTNYGVDLHRDNSIATAISMRRADIMVSRDNPQNLHQQRLSGVLNPTITNETEETTNTSTGNGSNGNNNTVVHHHAVAEEDELLFEKKKSVIILLGRLLLKCGCPCHRVVNYEL